jgi:hypothetical protein
MIFEPFFLRGQTPTPDRMVRCPNLNIRNLGSTVLAAGFAAATDENADWLDVVAAPDWIKAGPQQP